MAAPAPALAPATAPLVKQPPYSNPLYFFKTALFDPWVKVNCPHWTEGTQNY